MKLVVVLLLGAIQWVRTKPLNVSTKANITSSPEEQLVKFYDDKLVSLAPEICVKLDHLTKQILKDETVQLAATPFMLMFKRTIEDFRIIYTFYTRFEIQDELPGEFADKIDDYYPPKSNAHKDALYIMELLRKLGYEELRNEYKTEMKKFVTEEFLPNYEELNSRTSNQTEYLKKLKKWVMVLKECREYECYLNDFAKSSQTILQTIFIMVFHKMFEVSIIFSHNATTFAKDVVKDPKLLQLSPLVGKQLEQNLQDFIKIYNNLDHPLLVDMAPAIFYPIIFKFDNYTNISTKDRQLITNIFDDHGYTKLELNRILKNDETHRYESNDYVQEYQNYIATMNPNDLPQFLDAIDQFRRANTTEERMTALTGFEGFSLKK